MFLCFLKKNLIELWLWIVHWNTTTYSTQNVFCTIFFNFESTMEMMKNDFFFHLIENWEQLKFSLRPFADQLTKMMNGEIQQTCKKYPITVQRVPNLQKWDLLAIPIWNYLITIRRTTKIALGNRYI